MKTKNLVLTAVALAVLFMLPAAAQADPIVVTLDNAGALTVGGNVTFMGSVANTGPGNRFAIDAAATINYGGPGSIDFDLSPYFANIPLSIPTGYASGPVAFFNVTTTGLVTPGSYIGSFTAQFDDGMGNILDVTQDFIVNVRGPGAAVPEPATLFLLGTGLAGAAAAKRRKRRLANTA